MARAFGDRVTAFPTESAVRHNPAWPGYQQYKSIFDAAEDKPSGSRFRMQPPEVHPMPLPLEDSFNDEAG